MGDTFSNQGEKDCLLVDDFQKIYYLSCTMSHRAISAFQKKNDTLQLISRNSAVFQVTQTNPNDAEPKNSTSETTQKAKTYTKIVTAHNRQTDTPWTI